MWFPTGLDLEHGSVTKYVDYIKGKLDNHQQFLRALAKYTKKHNENPEACRLHSKEELKAKEVVKTNQTTGTKRIKPRRKFVEQWAWEEDHPGERYSDYKLELVQYGWHVYS